MNMLSAIQPSNQLTLGNYLGAIKNWVRLQNEYECTFFAVDLHAITVRQDPDTLRAQTYRAIAYYIAAGIDPVKATLFVQSHVAEHAELAWILTCYSNMGELNRMTQFKDKSAKQGQQIPTGIFIYPVLMASDILLYDTHLVPVGEDQKQHIEITRDLAIRMNNAVESGLFVVPEPYIPPVGARIMSLADPTCKMSKSDPDPNSSIYLFDTDDTIKKKFKRAVTDSGTEITADAENKPGIYNLLTIQSALSGKPITEIVQSYTGKMYGHLKIDTADQVIATIGPIRDRALEIIGDIAALDKLLEQGADRARERATRKVEQVYRALGFVNRARSR